MATPDAIKDTLERNVRAVTLRPSVGQGTAVTRVRLGADLRCDIEESSWTLAAGMTEKAIPPSDYGRVGDTTTA